MQAGKTGKELREWRNKNGPACPAVAGCTMRRAFQRAENSFMMKNIRGYGRSGGGNY